jgi:serine/threonine protein kinase
MQTLHSYQSSSNSHDLLNNRYKKVKRLGEGSYGTVFLAVDTKPEGTKRKVDSKVLNLLDKVDD